MHKLSWKYNPLIQIGYFSNQELYSCSNFIARLKEMSKVVPDGTEDGFVHSLMKLMDIQNYVEF